MRVRGISKAYFSSAAKAKFMTDEQEQRKSENPKLIILAIHQDFEGNLHAIEGFLDTYAQL